MRHRLRLLMARIAARETGGIVCDDRDGGAAQARAAAQDHLRHGGHADEIGAQDARGANLGRRLEARPGKPHIDALVELNAGASRRAVQLSQQRGVVGFRQRHETVRTGMADQRIGPGKVDVVGDRGQRRRAPFLVEAAGRVGQEQRLAAKRAERIDRDPHRARVPMLVIMAAALKQRHPPALHRPDHEAPGMALDARNRKARNVDVRDRGRVTRFIGERAEAGAEHNRERRQGIEAVGLQRHNGRVRVCLHDPCLVRVGSETKHSARRDAFVQVDWKQPAALRAKRPSSSLCSAPASVGRPCPATEDCAHDHQSRR